MLRILHFWNCVGVTKDNLGETGSTPSGKTYYIFELFQLFKQFMVYDRGSEFIARTMQEQNVDHLPRLQSKFDACERTHAKLANKLTPYTPTNW